MSILRDMDALNKASKQFCDTAETTSVQVVAHCQICGETSGLEQDINGRMYCVSVNDCHRRYVEDYVAKVKTHPICVRCGADETVWQEIFNEPHQPCTAPAREELGKVA